MLGPIVLGELRAKQVGFDWHAGSRGWNREVPGRNLPRVSWLGDHLRGAPTKCKHAIVWTCLLGKFWRVVGSPLSWLLRVAAANFPCLTYWAQKQKIQRPRLLGPRSISAVGWHSSACTQRRHKIGSGSSLHPKTARRFHLRLPSTRPDRLT